MRVVHTCSDGMAYPYNKTTSRKMHYFKLELEKHGLQPKPYGRTGRAFFTTKNSNSRS
jgi:hypothetical protein